MSAQETIKDGANGGGEGRGACTVGGCQCPAFTGNQSDCTRGGCGHGYNQHSDSK
uniref:Zinc-binding peptide 3 n=1 Tax=Russula atropurpurea TaxID=152952 RepID=A0A482M0X8_9AGAM|nr:zinc-binding peptide 3 [Russula atropurpurea]